MFQTFEVTADPGQGPPRLAALRRLMASDGLSAVIVPHADAHRGETVAPCDERLAWLTGFSGSAGFCIVLADTAGLFADGRYRLQARMQCADEITVVPWPETRAADWLAERLGAPAVIGYDPWLHTISEITALSEALPDGIALQPIANAVDRLWADRPGRPDAPFFAQAEELAGQSAADKRAHVGAALQEAGDAAAVLTLPDSIAWLLNIRGRDIPFTPVPHAFALLFPDGRVELFAAERQAGPVLDTLGPEVAVFPRDAFLARLATLDGPVRVDPASAPQIVAATLAEAGIEAREDADPCLLPKARKTAAEIAGAREAHLRDGAAMARFLAWLDAAAAEAAAAPSEDLRESDVVRALEGFRRDTNALRDISFETICGAGPHGAIIHYRVTEETDRALAPGELVLVDSGGQYLDGTTDITRTIAIGPPGAEEREMYTLVLRGMIAVSRARFPRGVGGQHLDALARFPLWTRGRDFDHGTGHGVGAYLSVHEGPQGISRRSAAVLDPGMIVSNEPGYYREGAFGIRIENLLAVRRAPALPGADDRDMLDFETLTFVPFDRRLIDTGLLSGEERDWIDSYHTDTLSRIAPRLDGPALDWLRAACAPL